MKVKNGFIIRNIAGKIMAVPVGERAQDLHGMVVLNETGAFIWKLLEKDQTIDSLTDSVFEEYEVSKEAAKESVIKFTDLMRKSGVLDD